jgi:hypothetical protein
MSSDARGAEHPGLRQYPNSPVGVHDGVPRHRFGLTLTQETFSAKVTCTSPFAGIQSTVTTGFGAFLS